MDVINQYDTVAVLEDIPEENLRRGSVGTVIEKYSEDAFEVEFYDRNTGVDYAMTVLKNSQLMKLYFAGQP